MRITKLLLVFAACAAWLSSCTKNANPSAANTSDTVFLLNHFLFQQGGNPSLGGWTFHPAQADDSLDFEKDTPLGDGTWSFKLHTSDLLGANNSLSQNFTNLKSGVYSLTAWLKYKYAFTPDTYPPGWISVIKTSGGVSSSNNQFVHDSTNWFPQTLLDTLTLAPSDTVTVLISAGARSVASNLHGNPIWVDDVTFKKLP